MAKNLKTAECVTPKHPDKMCDQISDAILDWYLKQDENSRVAVEVLGGHGKVFICGEVTSLATPIYKSAVEGIVRDITGKELEVEVRIVSQSPEIANGVDTGGAGDQGIMTGYACDDNKEMIPQEYFLARDLCKYIYAKYPYDGKTQITLNENSEIVTIVASFQNVSNKQLLDMIHAWVDGRNIVAECNYFANPAGDWNQGGFDADTGLTGRKLMVDNYGPQVAIGGGCFSGKDSTKVDRSGAYMARKLAVEILKSVNAKEVLVKLAYAIGVAQPVMVSAEVNGEVVDFSASLSKYDLTPAGIIKALDLKKPQFEKTAQWGHFGNGFKWDQ